MGVEDIIGIHNLVQSCKENAFGFDSDHETDRKSSKDTDNNDNNKTNRPYFLTPLTEELKKYGGMKFAIKEQSEKLDKLRKDIDVLEGQRQDFLTYFKGARGAINTVNSIVFSSNKTLVILPNVHKVKPMFLTFCFCPCMFIWHAIFLFFRRKYRRKYKKGNKHTKKGIRRSKDQ